MTKDTKPMKVTIETEALRRIRGFTQLADGEVGGMARVDISDGKLYIHDLQLFQDQEVGSASVEQTQEKFAMFLSTVERAEEFKFLWHSHGNMGTYLSTTDENCIASFLETSPFIISCVSNRSGEIFMRFDGIFEGLRLMLPVEIEQDKANYQDLEDEFKVNVRTKVYYVNPSSDEIKTKIRRKYPQYFQDYPSQGGLVVPPPGFDETDGMLCLPGYEEQTDMFSTKTDLAKKNDEKIRLIEEIERLRQEEMEEKERLLKDGVNIIYGEKMFYQVRIPGSDGADYFIIEPETDGEINYDEDNFESAMECAEEISGWVVSITERIVHYAEGIEYSKDKPF